MKKIYFTIILLALIFLKLNAQEIHVKADNQALNTVLIGLRDSYALKLSFDDKELSNYKITIDRTFPSVDSAFDYLLSDFPFSFEKVDEVYLFYPKKPQKVPHKKYILSGSVYDVKTLERLPLSTVLINQMGSITDENGNFNYESQTDSIFRVKISYLGYEIMDTILLPGLNQKIGLKSGFIDLGEVVVNDSRIAFSAQTGSKAGLMRINHKLAQLLPGNGDNAIFNLIRLQPGVLAGGEQSSELIIWGNYAGQSQVNFDGMTLWGLKNYNDNISVVNPYMAKDIQINKGGFDATLGERVGSIVDIIGVDGDKRKKDIIVNINNMTMNITTSIPTGRKAVIVGAFRQTYYNLYPSLQIPLNQLGISHYMQNSVSVQPDYIFRDGNLKYSGETENGNSYYISSFWGQDHYSYSVEQNHYNSTISQALDEKNKHYGASAYFNKLWAGKGNTELSIAYSALQSKKADSQNETGMGMGMEMSDNMHIKDENIQNNISELKAKVSGSFGLAVLHELKYGAGFIQNTSSLQIDSLTYNIISDDNQGLLFFSYLQDEFSFAQHFNLRLGFRNDYSIQLKKNYFQPRLNVAFKPFTHLKFNLSWGLYKQFIVLGSVVDQNNNYRYQWTLSDREQIPVSSAQHLVGNGVYQRNGFLVSIESYYKKTEGITRFVSDGVQEKINTGKSESMGLDFFIKQEYKGNTAWLSYSFGQTMEWFPYFQSPEYRSALQDQRHELKMAAIINLSPFYLSANYVFGSGFTQNTNLVDSTVEKYPYKRLDVAISYRFAFKKMRMETGFSILNVLNHENIKYSNLVKIPTSDNSTLGVYAEAVSFSPSLFLNISF